MGLQDFEYFGMFYLGRIQNFLRQRMLDDQLLSDAKDLATPTALQFAAAFSRRGC